jgi:hypothetical protein
MSKPKAKNPQYQLNQQGEFVIEDYNYSRPFANFFPGIAGKYGIPMWTFYVNRGQAISSFGTHGKDHAIVEFLPANKAWQLVSTYGFRTFIKIHSSGKTLLYEPFHNGFSNCGFNISNRMLISAHALAIEEENRTLGISVAVKYFNIPNDLYAGLARIVTVKNTGRKKRSIQLLDGLAQIVPFGTNDWCLKNMSRTIEAWMQVVNLKNKVPFFNLSVDPADRPEVVHIKEGNFYLGFDRAGRKARLIKPIVDPERVFGAVTDLSLPQEFISKSDFHYPLEQAMNSRMPCAFLPLNFSLSPGKEKTIYAIAGSMRSLGLLNSSVKRIASVEYLAKKESENKELIDSLGGDIYTKSSSKEFDLYAKQTYIDNIMRGGYPQVFKFGKSDAVYYLYSRKHGDLERDYNRFELQPAYFSQGNGNYRDVNQNRRMDTWFNPEIKDENLIYFFNLLQPDGFNPLVVLGASFIIKDQQYLKSVLIDIVAGTDLERMASFLAKPFTPGDLALFIEEAKIRLLVPGDEAIRVLLSHSYKTQEAQHGEGFWTDHWAYNLDLIENYLGVYPEKLREILFEKKEFTYFDNSEVVQPRSAKYTLYNGLPRQLKSVVECEEKRELIRSRKDRPNVVRTRQGRGEIYQTTLINKLVCLLSNKLASLDPFGVGIEMEANKPNWYDALNGLPALFGSSLCETLELKRLVIFLQEALRNTGVKQVSLNEEVHEFILGLATIIKEDEFCYWDQSACLKESYREKTKFGFSGKELALDSDEFLQILSRALAKLDSGIDKARDSGTYHTYFINEVRDYTVSEKSIRPLKFAQKPLPLFLEGQVHALRLAKTASEARALYAAVKSSKLFDKKLKMYKVTASLSKMPEEIGRCRVFTPGWLENESIWLHMEYKYLLELLRSGLHEEFYAEIKNTFIPFQKPERYGRSILENSSFIVSSAYPDKKLHGNGYVARLSGSTAEFLQIWMLMNAGERPFYLDDGCRLNLEFAPRLAGWLFDKKGDYSFKFLSSVLVTYHNKKRLDTFGKNAVSPKRIIFRDKSGLAIELSSGVIPSLYAEQVRLREIKKIDIYLG